MMPHTPHTPHTPSGGNASSDEDGSMDMKPPAVGSERGSGRGGGGKGSAGGGGGGGGDAGAKKTKGRVKIKMEFIDNKLRRYTTFSKRKTGIMKKAYELSTLTGTQVMLLVASETGHVYTFATRKLQPMITSDAGKALIQTCLNSPDPPGTTASGSDQRMSATGYEETELTYNIADSEEQQQKDDIESAINDPDEDVDEDDDDEEEADQRPPTAPPPPPPPPPLLKLAPNKRKLSDQQKATQRAAQHDQPGTGMDGSNVVIAPAGPIPSTSALITNSQGNLPPEIIRQLVHTGKTNVISEPGTVIRLVNPQALPVESSSHHPQPSPVPTPIATVAAPILSSSLMPSMVIATSPMEPKPMPVAFVSPGALQVQAPNAASSGEVTISLRSPTKRSKRGTEATNKPKR